jgi:hypothetical protein
MPIQPLHMPDTLVLELQGVAVYVDAKRQRTLLQKSYTASANAVLPVPGAP